MENLLIAESKNHKISHDVIYREIQGKLFALNESTGKIICLDNVGLNIWDFLTKEVSFAELETQLNEKGILISKDELIDFIKYLHENDLLQPLDSSESIVKNCSHHTEMELWRFIYKFTNEIYPVDIFWELTYNCNHNCIHCYEDCFSTKQMQDLNTDIVFEILKMLHKSGTFNITISGGEPFIRKDIFDIIEYAKNMNFSLTIYTNGTLLTEKDIIRIKKLNVKKVCISLFSMQPEIHENITKSKGSFTKTVNAIKLLRKHKVDVRIHCPMLISNYDDYKSVIKFAELYKCELIISPTIICKDDGDKSPMKYSISDNQVKQLMLDKDTETKMELDLIDVSNRLNQYSCDIVFSGLSISADGRVFPCHSFKLEIGHLLNQNIIDIWKDSEVLNKIRNTKIKNIEHCNTCPKVKYCLPCPAYAWTENKEIVGKSTISCRNASIRQLIDD